MNENGLASLKVVLQNERQHLSANASDEDSFVQALSGGCLHTEDSDWPTLSRSLSRKQIASLFPAICRAVVRGGGGYPELLIEGYSLLEQWQADQLTDTTSLSRCLESVRNLVFDAGLSSKGIWWVELSITMRLIDYAVAVHSGQPIHPIMEKYETFGYDFEEAIAKPPKH